MITIKTMLPKQTVTEEEVARVARMLARFFPDYDGTRQVPYLMMDSDPTGAYILDIENNWWMWMDEDDNQLLHITYRYTDIDPASETAFAMWVCCCHTGWLIQGK